MCWSIYCPNRNKPVTYVDRGFSLLFKRFLSPLCLWAIVFLSIIQILERATAFADDKVLPPIPPQVVRLPEPEVDQANLNNTYTDSIRSKLLSKFGPQAGNIGVHHQESNKGPDRWSVYGLAIPASSLDVSSNQVEKSNASQLAKHFFGSLRSELGIDPEALQGERVWTSVQKAAGNKKRAVVHMGQKYKGLRVVDSVTSVIFSNDRLVSYSSSYLPISDLELSPQISVQAAFEISSKIENEKGYLELSLYPRTEEIKLAESISGPQLKNSTLLASSLVVYPHKNLGFLQPELAWELTLGSQNKMGPFISYYLSAKSGKYLGRRFNSIQDGISGNIVGPVYEVNPQVAPVAKPLEGVRFSALQVPFPIFESISDIDGHYDVDNLDPNLPISYWLDFGGPDFIGSYPAIVSSTTDPAIGFAPSPLLPLNQENDFDLLTGSNDPLLLIDQASNVQYFLNEARRFFGRSGNSVFNLFVGPLSIPSVAVFVAQNSTDQDDYCVSNYSWASELPSGIAVPFSRAAEYDGFFNFNDRRFTAGGALDCDYGALNVETIFHEFVHHVQDIMLPSHMGFVHGGEITGRAILEAFSDYWAAVYTNDPIHGNGHLVGPNMTPLIRKLNPTGFEYQYADGRCDLADSYCQSQILSGTFWDMRNIFAASAAFANAQAGRDAADELIMEAMRAESYDDFWKVLYQVLAADDDNYNIDDGTPHYSLICQAFWSGHFIDLPYNTNCAHPPTLAATPTPSRTPTPTPFGFHSYPLENKITVPFNNSSIDSAFSKVIGSASVPGGTGTFSLGLRKYGGVAPWDWTQVVLPNGGSATIDDALLGNLNSSSLINNCYYDLQLKTIATGGSPVYTAQSTFKYFSTPHDEMPRMVCVFRTGHEGAENDACQMVAIVSDPKPAYYSVLANNPYDWRRGRPHLLGARPNDQYNWPSSSWTEPMDFGPVLCDPNDSGDCLRDCWNITGTAGNLNGGNDGLNNVFCAPVASCSPISTASCATNPGCSPVSFSGCEDTNAACRDAAFAALESMYHKIMYFHYSNREWSCGDDPDGPGVSCGHIRRFKSCDDDNGDQFYSLWAASDLYGPYYLARQGQYADGRTSAPIPGDAYDGFDQLYSKNTSGPALISIASSNPHSIARVGITPTANCQQCGCPSNYPYCNSSSGQCEQKCNFGNESIPFGECAERLGQIFFCNNGNVVPGCNRPECEGFACENSGRYCNQSSGTCDLCLNAGHCNDFNSCSLDSCVNSQCLNYIPNDCTALPAGRCGPSPSGCNWCGCKCNQKCEFINGVHKCVLNPNCDRIKCKECKINNASPVY